MPTVTTSAAQTSIADFLGATGLAPRQAHKALTVWPLVQLNGAAAAPGCCALVDETVVHLTAYPAEPA